VGLDAVDGVAKHVVGQAKHARYLDDLVEPGDGGLERFEGPRLLLGSTARMRSYCSIA
jgi:hypothetical protein